MMFVAGVPRAVSAPADRRRRRCWWCLILVDVLFAPPNWQIKLEDYQKRRLLVYFGRDFAPPNATPAERAEARARNSAIIPTTSTRR